MSKFIIQPHVRLQEWVAEEHGYFTDQGLDYEFETTSFAAGSSTTSSIRSADHASLDARSGSVEDMERGRNCDVSSACHWAVNAAASDSAGRMWGRGYSVSPSGIFVIPDSEYRKPEHLAGVPVAVGYHSGSHYSTIRGLEPFLAKPDITLSFVGQPNDRLRLMLQGELSATSAFGVQYYLLEQLGFRKLVDTTFILAFLIGNRTNTEDTERYFRALEKAQRDIDLEPELYKHYWLREMPEDLVTITDVRRFGPGERIVFEPYTREMFQATQRWMKSWDLLDSDMNTDEAYRRAVLV